MCLTTSYASYAICIIFLIQCSCSVGAENSPHRWECHGGKCRKMHSSQTSKDGGLSLVLCKMSCNTYGLLWPRPSVQADMINVLSRIDINKIDVQIEKHGRSDYLMLAAIERFKRNVALSIPEGVTLNATKEVLNVYLVNEDPNNAVISVEMKENYTLRVVSSNEDGYVNATIVGGSFFGVRHGLETLAQLILYDDMRDHLAIVGDVFIIDKPVYPYRGLLLDTSRQYYPIDSIKKTIDTMAVVKLNTFHWHISDSDSLPFVSERRPNLSKNGAYSPDKIYTKEAIREVVQFGRERGVRVLPEFDAPAHVGEGWQDTGLTVCFRAEPWFDYCYQPPCGHLNPAKSEVYEVLEDIYRDLADAFRSDMFHMGGDEVIPECWNTSVEIKRFLEQQGWPVKDTYSFIKLWAHFQTKVQKRAYKAFGRKLPLILWTSALTNPIYVGQYLNKDEYIIQVWRDVLDKQIPELLKLGYRLIISNYDGYYLDCGFDSWVGTGKSSCSYNSWKTVYDHSPAVIALEYRDQILGGEGALWSEQIGPSNLDGRAWPRAAALAERLWAEPLTSWEDAQDRLVHMQQRLVRMGIHADPIQPEWCYQNGEYCYGYETKEGPTVILDDEINYHEISPRYILLWHITAIVIMLILFVFLAAVMAVGLVYILLLSSYITAASAALRALLFGGGLAVTSQKLTAKDVGYGCGSFLVNSQSPICPSGIAVSADMPGPNGPAPMPIIANPRPNLPAKLGTCVI